METTFPYDILDYVSENEVTGLYFLDLDLGCDINSIELAKTIRTRDSRGFIMFVTADAESHVLTFQYMVEAMHYIVKGDDAFGDCICECLTNAQVRFTSNPAK